MSDPQNPARVIVVEISWLSFSMTHNIQDDFLRKFAHEDRSVVVAKLLQEAVAQAWRKPPRDDVS